MFVAGGLMWLNNVPGMFKPEPVLKPFRDEHEGFSDNKLNAIGWPFNLYGNYMDRIADEPDTYTGRWFRYKYDLSNSSAKYLTDLGIAVFILFGTAFLLEHRIRRMKNNLTPSREGAKV